MELKNISFEKATVIHLIVEAYTQEPESTGNGKEPRNKKDSTGKEDNAGTKPTIRKEFEYRPRHSLKVDLEVHKPSSQYNVLHRNILRVLNGVKADQVEDHEWKEVARLSGKPEELVRRYATARKLAKELSIHVDIAFAFVVTNTGTEKKVLQGLTTERLGRSIRAAMSKGLIEKLDNKEVDSIISNLQDRTLEEVREERLSDQQLSFNDIFELSGVDKQIAKKIAQLWRFNDGNDELFWRSFKREKKIGRPMKEKVWKSAVFGFIASGEPRLAKFLTSNLLNPKDAARLSFKETNKIVINTLGTDPDNSHLITTEVFNRASELYPTTALLRDMPGDDNTNIGIPEADLLNTLQEANKFNLLRTPIHEFLEKNELTKQLSEDQRNRLIDSLKIRQRLLRLGAGYQETKHLLNAGYKSAYDIVQRGKKAFMAAMGKMNVKAEKAEELYSRAQETWSKTTLLATKFNPIFNGVETTVTPFPAFVWDSSPNLKNLFQEQSLCSCERCRSLFSPAAYLVDLLAFLENPDNNAGSKNALEVLTEDGSYVQKARRPEIVDIKLSCENTNTLIPYIDIVNEVLENAVSPRSSPAYQTESSEEDLSVIPDHINEDAYQKLASTVFPFTLPFDIYTTELRIIQERLGTSRRELLEIFTPLVIPNDPDNQKQFYELTEVRILTDELIVGEVFSLSTNERKLITGQPIQSGTPTFAQHLWGYKVLNLNWLKDLENVSKFLSKANLSYPELLTLLSLKSVQAAGRLTLEFNSPTDCNPDHIRIDGLNIKGAGFISRILRLWRKVGWSIYDLDRALTALSSKDFNNTPILDAPLLIKLSHVQRLKEGHSVSIPELLSWWANLDIVNYNSEHLPRTNSFYYEVFEKQQRGLPGGTRFPLTDVNSGSIGRFGAHEVDLAGALGISSEEGRMLISTLSIADSDISLTNLSLVYRYASLAKYLGAKMTELLTFINFAGDPFLDSTGTPSTTLTMRFIQRWETLSVSSFSLSELNYLLVHVDQGERRNGPDPVVRQALQDSIQNGLRSPGLGADDTSFVAERIAQHFALELSVCASLLTQWLNTSANTSFMDELLKLKQDPLPAGTVLFDEIYERLHKVTVVIKKIGIQEVSEIDWLFGTGPSLEYLDLAQLPLQGPQSLVDIRTRFSAWEKLIRWTQFRDEIVAEHKSEYAKLFRIAQGIPSGSSDDLPLPFDATTRRERSDYITTLNKLTGWHINDLKYLIGLLNNTTGHVVSTLNTQFPYHFRDEQLPFLVSRCFKLLGRIGLPVDQLYPNDLMLRDQDARFASKFVGIAREVLRTKLGPDQWPAVAKEIRDQLREQQRRALVDYLVADWNKESSGSLYDHFLLDVEMSSCRKTTRVHSAISTVQLFVERVLMNLEPKVAISDEGAVQWEWMRNYPTWEANRKVFLYPQNYLKQEWRSDKTPFFKELEDELMQHDISMDKAETAFLHYLEKLDEVSRLQICGMYVEEGPKGRDTIHVFGRTRNSPNHYYYRRLLNRICWTPWEKVDVDIEGDHLIPIIYNRRLYLFWPIISEKDESPFKMDAFLRPFFDVVNLLLQVSQAGGAVVYSLIGAYNKLLEAIEDAVHVDLHDLKIRRRDFEDLPSDPLKEAIEAVGAGLKLVFDTISLHPFFRVLDFLPKKQYDIQLAWSEYRHGQWTSKKMSNSKLTFLDLTGPLLREFQEILSKGGYPSEDEVKENEDARKKKAPDAPFDRKRLFTFNGRIENDDQLVIQSHVTRLGIDVGNNVYDGTYLKFLGSFVLDDAYGALNTHKPDLGSFDFVTDILADIQDLAFGALQSALQFVSGEPITQDDDPQGTLKKCVIPDLLKSLDYHPSIYRVIAPHQYQKRWLPSNESNSYTTTDDGKLDDQFFIQDAKRTYCFFSGSFHTHYHPYITEVIRQLNRYGLPSPGLMNPSLQQLNNNELFEDTYDPTEAVLEPYPTTDIDYELPGAYSIYNWELFVHGPLLIAERLSANQKHEDALKWLHFVFDPTDSRNELAPRKYWRPRPFVEASSEAYQRESVRQLMLDLAGAGTTTAQLTAEAQVKAWQQNPFNPYLLASMRPTALQKGVVMQYLDTLIAWGDQMFRQETITSINMAALLYRRAEAILGPKPKTIFPHRKAPIKSFKELKPLDALANTLVELEHFTLGPDHSGMLLEEIRKLTRSYNGVVKKGKAVAKNGKLKEENLNIDKWRKLIDSGWSKLLVSHQDLYFCIPQNDKLLKYWDIIEDRQRKIRYCQNIDGVITDLSPFENAIEPELFIRAQQAGIDLSAILADINTGVPSYRFTYLLQNANQLCAEVRSYGSALLSALEKKDAEEMALLRQSFEGVLLNAQRQTKQRQIDEAKANLQGLQRSLETVKIRKDYYSRNLTLPISLLEATQLTLMGTSLGIQGIQAGVMMGAVSLSLLPEFITGFPIAATQVGGSNTSNAADRAAQNLGILASIAGSAGSLVGTMAGYERRSQEWQLQKDVAESEMKQLEKQIIATEVRLAIAQIELDNHDLMVQQNQEMHSLMHSKFTNKELYVWMTGELSGLYFESYKQAYDQAKKAEKAFRNDLSLRLDDPTNYIQFGYWDSLKQGLLSGERLQQALKRLEIAYLEQNKRSFEIQKHISLRKIDPLSLIELIENGTCEVVLPEWLFDMDYPGHYKRRIKSVTISIPCVVGPYTSINCTLRLKKSKVRISNDVNPAYKDQSSSGNPDSRFFPDFVPTQAIATSHGLEDSGVFQLDFRDERYLPFEGAGAESTWQLDLPRETNYFDRRTITDVILHMRFSSIDGGQQLRDGALQELRSILPEKGIQLIDLESVFPSEWHRFLKPAPAGAEQELVFTLTPEHFPFYTRNKTISFTEIKLLGDLDEPSDIEAELKTPMGSTSLDTSRSVSGIISKTGVFGTLHDGTFVFDETRAFLGEWSLKIRAKMGQDYMSFDRKKVRRLAIIAFFKTSYPMTHQ